MTSTRKINIAGKFNIGDNQRFVFIAGPCAIESEETTLLVARELKTICSELGVHLIFKSSFDKANRTSINSARGVGMEQGLAILHRVKTELDLPIITDIHETWQCQPVSQVADILQIPAFLSRQTDLLLAAAKTGKVINVKKGQFMAPWDMKNVVDKLQETGNENILLCERGTSFGYNNLVVDMAGLVEMRQYGFPVVFDATHSTQKPGNRGNASGGNREMAPHLMRAALAIGVDAIFAEVHPDPDFAISDGANQIRLSQIKEILKQAITIDDVVKGTGFASAKTVDINSSTKDHPETTFAKKTKNIKLFLTDVDGVLTDAGMYYTETGDELKKFNTHDGMGLQLIREKGLKTGIITSENTKLVERRANKLKLDYLYQGRREGGKLATARELCKIENISLDEIAYIGDDINCLELLSNVGIAACPANAVKEVKQIPGIIHLSKKGGDGCVREFIEMIISSL